MDWVTLGVPRFDEVSAAFGKAVHVAIDWKADLFLCLGDVCNPDSGSIVLRCAREIVWAANVLQRGNVRSAWVCGNHDVAGDGLTTSLDPLCGLGGTTMVFKDKPDAKLIGVGGGSWTLVGLPYPSSPKGWGKHSPISEFGNLMNSEWSIDRSGDRVIVVGHLSIEGVQPGEESDELARGKDCFWPTEEVEKLKPKLKLCGHHHHRQVTKEGIRIVGSLARLTFGHEGGEDPGFLKIEL